MDVSGAALLVPVVDDKVSKPKKTVTFQDPQAPDKASPQANINILLPNQGDDEANNSKKSLKAFSSRRMQNYDADHSSDSDEGETEDEEPG